VISWVRHPVDRCLSHFYHLGGRDYANLTDDNILDFARRNCNNYMAGYLGKPYDSSAEEIWRRFDFVGTTERFDESMILLQQRLPMPVRLGDILYVKAKKSSEREKRGGVMHKPYAQQSKRVRDFFDSDFKVQNNLDFALYRLVNTSLDDQGKAMGLERATSTVRVIHLSSQNCIQADIQSAKPLPHMNLNVSERLICALRGLSRFTDRVTGKKTKQLESEENANMEMMEMEHGDDGGARDGARGARGCARLRAWVGRDLFFQQMMTTI
jgi:hypothetical protein